jgi:hypothetical protein
MITRLSVKPITSNPCCSKSVRSLSITRDQNIGDRTRPWEQPLVVRIVICSSSNLAVTIQHSSIQIIPLTVSFWIADLMGSNPVLLKHSESYEQDGALIGFTGEFLRVQINQPLYGFEEKGCQAHWSIRFGLFGIFVPSLWYIYYLYSKVSRCFEYPVVEEGS